MAKRKKSKKKQSKTGPVVLGLVGLVVISGAVGDKTSAATAGTASPKQSTTGLSDLEARCLKVGKAATKVGITGNDRARIMAISAAESKCKSIDNAGTNKDGTVDVCEMQVNKTANADLFKGRDWHDLDDCMWIANKVLGRQGYQAWSSYNNRSYREFVPMALKLNGGLS